MKATIIICTLLIVGAVVFIGIRATQPHCYTTGGGAWGGGTKVCK